MIPSEIQLREPFLIELYQCENQTCSPSHMDENLQYYSAKDFGVIEEVIEESDLIAHYNNGYSKWQNRIRELRRTLINDGILYSPKVVGQGVWKLTPYGIQVSKNLYNKYDLDDPWVDNLNNQIINKSEVEKEFFVEGKKQLKIHKRIERNNKLVVEKKLRALESNYLLPCEICNFSFKEKYGEIGEAFIEAHHIAPLSQINEETESTLDDLILICSNCHRMIHKKNPPLTPSELKDVILNKG